MENTKDITTISKTELVKLLTNMTEQTRLEIMATANEIRNKHYGKGVYIRGLIEFTNYCKNNCYYCGIRRDNKKVERYRLNKEQILFCCEAGYNLGYRTFVLQGGEDAFYTDEIMVDIVSSIKQKYPDCALTLSIGEKSYETYKKYHDAGADRYLLRHETANEEHYKKLHPPEMSLTTRKQCLLDLKQIGFQVGAGFMVGSPYQTMENIAEDLLFLKSLKPEMVGIGPFIPQKDTPFGEQKAGTVELTITLLAIIRILLPTALIPATTAVGTLDLQGREKAIKAGANVVMPNLSPLNVRKKYLLYDNKICTGEEAAECKNCLENRIKSAGFEMDYSRGDHLGLSN
jgi:biotin synthase